MDPSENSRLGFLVVDKGVKGSTAEILGVV